MRNAWIMLAVIGMAVVGFLPPRVRRMIPVRKMMEEAFNRRYRWNESLKGFSADFTLSREGKTVKGSLRADVTKPHGGVEVVCDDEEVKKLVQDTVGSTVTHTRAASFDKAFGSSTFAISGEACTGVRRLP